MMGRFSPVFSRSINSVASSMMVMSAAKSVSYTPSKPSRRRAAAILPSTLVPTGIPKDSPRVARTLGAVWMMTCFWGLSMAAHTSSVSTTVVMAPVGQATMH